MRGVGKKMFISILTSVIVFVTMVATTFAWVGIFTYANTDQIQFNLKVNKSSNYFLTIAADDFTDSKMYGEEIPLNDIQKQVLKNKGVQISSDYNSVMIDSLYNKHTVISQSTIILDNNENIDHFESIVNLARGQMSFEESDGYIAFDIYLTVDTVEGITDVTTGINSFVALDDITNSLVGKVNDYFLHQGNTIRNNRFAPSNFDWTKYDAHKSLTNEIINDGVTYYEDKRNIRVDSSSAARFALEVYNPIKLVDTYTGDETPINTIVYQGGTALPTYDETTDVYSMGGILPEEYNFGIQEVNALYHRDLKVPQSVLDYESKVKTLTGSKTDNIVWNAPAFNEISTQNVNYLGCMDGIQTKQKIRVYFWFEGWDADCMSVIVKMRTALNLIFTADIDV